MAGALTANAVSTTVASPSDPISDAGTILGGVDFLSPVDGANNALLTALIILAMGEDDAEITFQWYRASFLPDELGDAVLGAAVGDPWVVAFAGIDDDVGPVTILAIDKGAGATSGYALKATLSTAVTVSVELVYVDAVLFD